MTKRKIAEILTEKTTVKENEDSKWVFTKIFKFLKKHKKNYCIHLLEINECLLDECYKINKVFENK